MFRLRCECRQRSLPWQYDFRQLNGSCGPVTSWRAHTVRKIAGSASYAHLPVVGGMATYRFQKMLRVQWRGTIRHLPTEIDRPATVLRIRDGLRYRLHFRKGRSTKNANILKLSHFLNAPFRSTRAVG